VHTYFASINNRCITHVVITTLCHLKYEIKYTNWNWFIEEDTICIIRIQDILQAIYAQVTRHCSLVISCKSATACQFIFDAFIHALNYWQCMQCCITGRQFLSLRISCCHTLKWCCTNTNCHKNNEWNSDKIIKEESRCGWDFTSHTYNCIGFVCRLMCKFKTNIIHIFAKEHVTSIVIFLDIMPIRFKRSPCVDKSYKVSTGPFWCHSVIERETLADRVLLAWASLIFHWCLFLFLSFLYMFNFI